MKEFPSWNQKEPLLRVLVILACLFISSLVLLAYQGKLYNIVNGFSHSGLFWANAILTVALFLAFQVIALICNARLRKKDEDRLP